MPLKTAPCWLLCSFWTQNLPSERSSHKTPSGNDNLLLGSWILAWMRVWETFGTGLMKMTVTLTDRKVGTACMNKNFLALLGLFNYERWNMLIEKHIFTKSWSVKIQKISIAKLLVFPLKMAILRFGVIVRDGIVHSKYLSSRVYRTFYCKSMHASTIKRSIIL